MLIFFGGIYLVLTAGFIARTYLEGEAKALGWTFWRIAGLLLCLVWPVLLIAVIVPGVMTHWKIEKHSVIGRNRIGRTVDT